MNAKPDWDAARARAALLGAPLQAQQQAQDEPEPTIDAASLAAANARHDMEHGNPFLFHRTRVRSSWIRGRR